MLSECFICKEFVKNNKIVCKKHRNYKLGLRCKTCNIFITDTNKTGFCIKHNKIGSLNPFFGKKHSKESLELSRIKNIKSSCKNWQNPIYREKVIKSISKPRNDNFKKQQSKRFKKWYEDNPEQRQIRSNQMKQSWKDGKIKPNLISLNESKAEKQFFNDLKNIYVDNIKKESICENGKWFIPDVILVDIKHIIEFFGDFWHANPKKYKANDIVHHNIKAKTIWENDKNRLDKLEQLGYFVHVFWQSEYKENKQDILNWFENHFCWDTCSF